MAWPKQTTAEMTKFYGKVNTNQVMLILPFPMKLAWKDKKGIQQTITKFSINKKCHDSALRVLTKVGMIYSAADRVRLGINIFSGCLNPRKMRGGNDWSMHAWGAAIDFDNTRNQLKWGRDKAKLASKDAVPFWEAWEEEGWVSLGRARNFDWMHVQAARL